VWGARRAPDRGGIINDARQRPFLPMWGGFDLSVRSPLIFFFTPTIFSLLLGVWGKGWQGWVGEFKGLGRDFRIAVKTRPKLLGSF